MSRIPPPWETDWHQSPEAAKDKGGFKPGVSGNPAGKPKGTKHRLTLLSEQIAEALPDVVTKVTEEAKDGDMQAAKLLLERWKPPVRPQHERVKFALDPTKPLAEQAQQVLVAVARGEVSPDIGKMLVDCIGSLAAIRHGDEFGERIAALEEALRLEQQSTAPGGVMQTEMH